MVVVISTHLSFDLQNTRTVLLISLMSDAAAPMVSVQSCPVRLPAIVAPTRNAMALVDELDPDGSIILDNDEKKKVL